MKVIFLKDVKGKGRRFEEKEIADGFALNFLIPERLAVPSNSPAASQVKSEKEDREKSRLEHNVELGSNISSLAHKQLETSLKANDKGHLFAALTPLKIGQIIKKGTGLEIPAEYIELPLPIREVGTHKISVSLGDKTTHFTLKVNPLD